MSYTSRLRYSCIAAAFVVAALPFNASASELLTLSDPGLNGLSAEVEFTLAGPTTLVVRIRNTSTGVPAGFDSSDQLLTGVSWDFGDPGGTEITGGSAVIGPTSASVDFESGSYGPDYDVSGEYGYGNAGGSGALPNFVSGNTAGATPFGGANLDGPAGLDGPQAGLVADPILVDLGGLGAIQNEIIATLTLSESISDLDFLYENHVRVEFGSDAAFIETPEPGSMLLLLAGVLLTRRRR
jgi:hypothetical protein